MIAPTKLFRFALFLALLLAPHARAQTPIQWQPASLRLVQKGGNYARIARFGPHQAACVYERGGVQIKRSFDNGATWGEEILVARLENYNAANPELLILPRGDWLCVFNGRPRRDSGLPYTISFCRSADKGLNWSAPQIAFTAGTTGGVGCWEPRAINAPDGTIQIYFANEAPYDKTNEQEISRLISRDGGRTWSAPQTVSLRAGHRDGMPVPVCLRNGRVVMAIEDDGLNGAFKPAIIETGSEAASGDSERRWSALQAPLAPRIYAGAPYLCQMPSGATVLSAQISNDGNLDRAQMAVWTGDANARDFAAISWPFAGLTDARQLWNCLWVKDARTVTAVASTSVNGVGGVWCVDGVVSE